MAGLRAESLRVAVVRREARRYLIVTVRATQRASARTELVRARRLPHRTPFGLRAGRTVLWFRLPTRVRPGRFTFVPRLRAQAGRPQVHRRSVVVRRY